MVDEGLKHLPDSYRLHLQRGEMLAQRGFYEESGKETSRSPAVFRLSESAPYVALGFPGFSAEKTAKAMEVLRARVKAKPDDFLLAYMLGLVLKSFGE